MAGRGRPTVMTKIVIGKLEEVFLLGGTDTEACLYADISPDTLYAYQRENPDFIKRKDQLKEQPFLDARRTIAKSVKDNPVMALEYMKRKKKKEFGDNVDMTTNGKDLPQPIIPLNVPANNSMQQDSGIDEAN